MRNRTAILTLAAILSSCSIVALAETPAAGAAAPPSALPGLNQGKGSQPNEDKGGKNSKDSLDSNSGTNSKTKNNDPSPKNSKHQEKQAGKKPAR